MRLVLLLGVAISLVPSPAAANAGTPLLWASLLHLFIINLVIGYIEGGLLSRFLPIPRNRATAVLIFANYASAWIGMYLLGNRLSHSPAVTIENLRTWLWLLVAVAFLLTLLIEYPFFWWLLRGQKDAASKSLKATLMIHSLSYLLLLGYYGISSQTSLLTQLSVVSPAQMPLNQNYSLYFIDSNSGSPVRMNLSGEPPTAAPLSTFNSLRSETSSSFGPVPKLTGETEWQYYINVASSGTISGYNRSRSLRFSFALATPFVAWSVSSATHLLGDFVVFQLGDDQICLLQPEERTISLIARGKEPTVVSN